MCRFITKNNELYNDLVNEVVLYLLQNKRLVEIYEKEDIYNYAFRIAYCTWHNTNSKQSFKALYRDYDELNSVDVSDLKYKLKQEDEDTTIDVVNESISKLKNGIQRQTLEKYISLGCNLKELSNEVGVSRYHLKKFIDETCKQIKIIYDRSN